MIPADTPRLEGRRVVLRAVTPEDVNRRYCDWLNDAEVNRYLETRFEIQTPESVASYVRKTAADPRQRFWAICLPDGTHIGNIKLGAISAVHRTADLSLFIGEKDQWGRGCAAEAIALVCEHAFRTLELHKLKAGAYAENAASIRAFEKCGFRREGLLLEHAVSGGRHVDIVVLGRLATDPTPAARSIVAVVQARMSSSRLPGKVLKSVVGKPLLALQLERVARAKRIQRLVVATSERPDDDAIEALATGAGVGCYRGALDDVLDRVYRAAKPYAPDYVVRLTADCPLADPEVIDAVIDFCVSGGYDYASNALQPTFPDGLDVEVARFACLETAWREARLPSEREHVMPYLHRRPDRFRIGVYRGERDLSHLRWTVDEPEDLELVTRIYEALYRGKPAFTTADVLTLIEREPRLAAMNARHTRNAGSRSSIEKDAAFTASESGAP